MLDEEFKNKDEDEKETDPFTQFMFGPNFRKSRHQEEERQDEVDIEKEPERRSKPQHDDWLFGGRERPDDSLNGKVNHILNNINYEELMNNIDTLMTSASQLKPLLKKASPFLEQFWKKKV